MNNNKQKNKGFALLLSLIISSIALAIGLSMLNITLKQLTLGTTTRGSEIAFQATNAGMECLRYVRNLKSDEFVSANSSISVDCFGGSINFTTDSSNAPLYKYTHTPLDWNSPANALCIDMELYLVDASLGDQSFPLPNGTKLCAAGDICTFGFVRGYNRSCTEKATSIFTVQRELTVEF